MFSTPSPFSWQAPPLPPQFSVPGYTFAAPRTQIWHRALWAAEGTYALCTLLDPGFTDIFCACQVAVTGGHSTSPSTLRPRPEHVKRALLSLRSVQPAVAARLAWPLPAESPPNAADARLVYEDISDESALHAWTDEVFQDLTGVHEHAEALIRAFGRGFDAPPTTLCSVYYIATSETDVTLVVRGAHALFDSFGLMRCLDTLIATLADIVGGVSIRELSSPLDLSHRLVGSAVDYTKVSWDAAGENDSTMLQTALKILGEVKRSSGIPIFHPEAQPTTLGLIIRTVSPGDLQGIIVGARAHGCTFYPVAFAAMVLATMQVNPPLHTEGLAVPVPFTPVNLRYRGIIDRDTNVLSALGYNSVVAKDLGRFVDSRNEDDIYTIAKEVGAQIQEQQDQIPRIGVWAHKFVSQMMAIVAEKAKHSSPMISPRVSSMGVMDKYLAASHDIPSGGRLTLSSPIVTVSTAKRSSILGFLAGAHIFTWQGTLYCCFGFSEAFMGTMSEQTKNLQQGLKTASMLEWSEAFMTLLTSVKA